MLGREDILRAIEDNLINIEPFNKKNLQPSSYDLHLAPILINPDGSGRTLYPGNDKLILEANAFKLGSSIEYIDLSNNITAMLHTRSSIGRLGLSTHATAGLIDAGFHGEITYELKNQTEEPIEIDLNEPIAQLTFHKLITPVKSGYNGTYNGQREPRLSKYIKGD